MSSINSDSKVPYKMILTGPLPQGYTVGAGIRVDKNGDQLRVTVNMQTGTVDFDAKITLNEIYEYCETARKCFAIISLECEEIEKEDDEVAEAYLELAKVGATLASRLIPNIKLQQRLLDILCHNTIQVSSKNIFPPVEVFYCGDPYSNDKIDRKKFWGMRGVISRSIIHQDILPPDIFETPDVPRVRMAAYMELPAVKDKEVPYLRNLDSLGHISLMELEPLSNKQSAESIKKFCEFLKNKHEVSHWACHLEGKGDSVKSTLFFTDDFRMTLDAAKYMKLRVEGAPVVIFNACCSGSLHPRKLASWVELLTGSGAASIVATEFEVSDEFAPLLIKRLYDSLLQGVPIGRALLNVRNILGPVGLGYVLYASPQRTIMNNRRDNEERREY